ncbi:hypothetical protein KUCAC02_005870, partial [Chaenocephalus aceratus]
MEWDRAPGAAQYVCQEAGLQVPLLDEDPHWEEVFVTAGSSLCSRFPQPTHPTEWISRICRSILPTFSMKLIFH